MNTKRFHEYSDEELINLGRALLKGKVQCGHCSDSYILLEVAPHWDYGFYECENCLREDNKALHLDGSQ